MPCNGRCLPSSCPLLRTLFDVPSLLCHLHHAIFIMPSSSCHLHYATDSLRRYMSWLVLPLLVAAAVLAIVATLPPLELLLTSWLGYRSLACWYRAAFGTPAALGNSVIIKVIFELVSNLARERIPLGGWG
jgi:hypothetical protein